MFQLRNMDNFMQVDVCWKWGVARQLMLKKSFNWCTYENILLMSDPSVNRCKMFTNSLEINMSIYLFDYTKCKKINLLIVPIWMLVLGLSI